MRAPPGSKFFAFAVLPTVAGITLGTITRPEPGEANVLLDDAGKTELQSVIAVDSDTRLSDRLSTLELAEFPKLITALSALPEHQRQVAIDTAVARWAKLDPMAAEEFLLGPSGDGLPGQTLKIVYSTWASINLEALLASTEKDTTRPKALSALSALAATDAARAWKLCQTYSETIGSYDRDNPLDENAQGRELHQLCSAVFQNWLKQEDPTFAIKASLAAEGDIPYILAQQLANKDPDQLSDLFLSGIKLGVMERLIEGWRQAAPEATLAQARSLLDHPRFESNPHFLSRLPELAADLSREQLVILAESSEPENEDEDENDPSGGGFDLYAQQLQRIYDELEVYRDDPQFRQRLASSWAREDPPKGIRWLETLPKAQRNALLPHFLEEWAGADHAAASEYLSNLPASEDLFRAIVHTDFQPDTVTREELWDRSREWYEALPEKTRFALIAEQPERALVYDPKGVLDWSLGQLPQGAINEQVENTLNWWLVNEGEPALGWLLKEASPATRDKLLSRLQFPPLDPWTLDELNLPSKLGVSVLDLIGKIPDPELRRRSLRELVHTQYSFAIQYSLDQADLPAPLRAEIQEMIDAGETLDASR